LRDTLMERLQILSQPGRYSIGKNT
jgi:hypothetical protein